MSPTATLTARTQDRALDRIRRLVQDQTGITLKENKCSLVKARIAKRMLKLGLIEYDKYLCLILDDASGRELQYLVDAVSTNTTSFYRESDHFKFIRSVVTGWMEKGKRSFRFWSAASSTGEEPYTLAIELRELFGQTKIETKILATDINQEVLIAAQKGIYSEDSVLPVPRLLRNKYFTRQSTGNRKQYAVVNDLKKMILFRQFNLMTPSYPIRPDLDMIICRNVMIYFDQKLRRLLAAEFERLIKPGGYLLIGHAESLTGIVKNMKCVKPSIYVKE